MTYGIVFQPLSLFFYSWQFLFVLSDGEQQSRRLKLFYSSLAYATMSIIPSCFVTTFAAFVINYSKAEAAVYYPF